MVSAIVRSTCEPVHSVFLGFKFILTWLWKEPCPVLCRTPFGDGPIVDKSAVSFLKVVLKSLGFCYGVVQNLFDKQLEPTVVESQTKLTYEIL